MRFGSKLNKVEFTTVMMDEAAQCMEAWVWGLLRPDLKYIYLADKKMAQNNCKTAFYQLQFFSYW